MTQTSENETKLLLTREEVLRRLRIGKTTLYRLRESGELPVVDFGPGTRRYHIEDVDRLAERFRRQVVA